MGLTAHRGVTFGLAITTHNRQSLLDDTLAAVKTHTPADIPVVVVDDGSNPPALVPDWVTLVRHDSPRGIPVAKNTAIAALMAAGVEHLFLFDDDTRPNAAEWWAPYVDGPEPHYQFSWLRFTPDNRPVPKMAEIYRDPNLVAYTWSMGCLLYVTAGVVDRVGGMHPVFGRGFEEHAEYSQRIHNAGFTTFVHQDHPDMADRVWAADQHYAAQQRSFAADPDRDKRLARNQALRTALAGCTDFVDYRPPQGRDVVLASYFTGGRDVQRNQKLPADTSLLKPLMDSLAGHDLVVLHDTLDLPAPHHKTPAPLCAYQQRWLTQWQWLRDHPDVRWVWCVDATDVTCLRDPFTDLTPATLYVGDETTTLGNRWMRTHCPTKDRHWLTVNANKPLLNCGVVGGDRTTVMRLCQLMTDLWAASDRRNPLYEMCFFNQACEQFPIVVHGRHVTTEFKSYLTEHPTAKWAHK